VIFAPTEKFNKTEILKYQDYVSMQNGTLSLLLDVYFVHDASIFGQNNRSYYKINNGGLYVEMHFFYQL